MIACSLEDTSPKTSKTKIENSTQLQETGTRYTKMTQEKNYGLPKTFILNKQEELEKKASKNLAEFEKELSLFKLVENSTDFFLAFEGLTEYDMSMILLIKKIVQIKLFQTMN